MKYAVVLTCDTGYLTGVQSIVNSSKLYGNDVDFHISVMTNTKRPFKLKNHLSNVFVHDWNSIVEPGKNCSKVAAPKAVRFMRYKLAYDLCDAYDAIQILDADMLVVGNFMAQFELAVSTRELVMVRNLQGIWPPEIATVDNIKNACMPPFHCTGTFFNCKNFKNLLLNTHNWMYLDGCSDMATLFKEIIKSGYDVKKIIPLDNRLWIMTYWHKEKVYKTIEDEKPVLWYGDPSKKERIIMVHGKWFIPKWFDKDTAKCPHDMNNYAWNNATIFRDLHEQFCGPSWVEYV
jgi:lipopolysaccharide biosynthesis glycosyltransferase